jgi:hypothetical protein
MKWGDWKGAEFHYAKSSLHFLFFGVSCSSLRIVRSSCWPLFREGYYPNTSHRGSLAVTLALVITRHVALRFALVDKAETI